MELEKLSHSLNNSANSNLDNVRAVINTLLLSLSKFETTTKGAIKNNQKHIKELELALKSLDLASLKINLQTILAIQGDLQTDVKELNKKMTIDIMHIIKQKSTWLITCGFGSIVVIIKIILTKFF